MEFKLNARPKHPLFGAEARARRASVHIRSLRRHLRGWASGKGRNLDRRGRLQPPKLARLPLYNIACVCNDERHVANTQFLICDSPDDFWAQATGKHPATGKKVTCRLAHVPPHVIDRFAQLQPWSTPPCEWTARLRDLSNPDKHMAMANLRSVTKIVPGDHPDVAELVPGVQPNPDETYVTMQVFFADTGDDVEDTLVLLQREVLALIEEFKPAFRVRI